MKETKIRRRLLLLLITTCLLVIAGCNFPGQDKDDNLGLVTPTPESNGTSGITADSMRKSRIEKFTLTMPQLGNRPRNIQVYLPPNYDSSELSYPVLYFFDGDSLFNPPPERVGDYLMDETLDRLYEEQLTEGIIVVGIEYDPAYPWSEYMPWINPNMRDWVKAKNSEPTEGGEERPS